MIESTSGLILRTRPLTETSLIVQWLTPAQGRISTVAKGARRPKSPFQGKLDLFYLGEFTFQRSRRSELHILREVKLRESHSVLRRDLSCLQQAAYGAGLIEIATETETPLPEIYELMCGFLRLLQQHGARPRNVFAFELKLLSELGLRPDLDATRLTPGARQVVRALTEADWPTLASLRLSPAQETELRQFLQGFLLFHLDRLPKGRDRAVHG